MKYLSICSGIEAASVAWHPLGWEPLAFSEIEPFPRAVLAHHYPSVPLYGDFTQLRDEPTIVDADVLVGGTPCQAFSVAGLRNSLADERGNLSLEFVRLADAIDNLRLSAGREPAVIVWENVPGVLSVKDNAFGCFLAGLAGDVDPYIPPRGKWTNAGVVAGPQRTVAWRVLDAQYFGLAQRRRRVFVVASARDGFDPAAVLFECEGVRRDTPPSRKAGQDVAGTIDASLGRSRGAGTNPGALSQWPADLAPTLNAHFGEKQGLEDQHIRGGQDYSCPPISMCLNAGAMGRCDAETETLIATTGGVFDVAAFHPTQDPISSTDGSTHALGCGSPSGQASVAVAYAFQPRIARNGRGDMGDVVNALNAQSGETGKGDAAPCVAIGFSSKDHGADATVDLAPTLRAMPHHNSHPNGGGQMAVAIPINTMNAMRSPEAAASTGFGVGEEGEAMFTLTKGNHHAVAFGGDVARTLSARHDSSPCVDRGMDVVAANMAVRRLTPTECERLQGFPDGYTMIPWKKKPADDCPDGPRYKALGNSMAVPVMRWIGRRIAERVR